MLIEWFGTWIAGKAFGFLVKTIISQEFLQELVKDYAKDFFRNIIHTAVTAPFQREPLQKAEVMAFAEFLQLMQQDLEYGELTEEEIANYKQPLQQFLKQTEVKEILGAAFDYECEAINTKRLQEIWYQLTASISLPEDFKWRKIGKEYLPRVTAVQQLAQAYKDDPDTKTFLQGRATADDDGDVRGTAVNELAKAYKYQPELFDIYYNCAGNDPFEGSHDDLYANPRRVALEIIVKQYPQHPQTLPLLRDRAENDPDEKVRKYAQEKLAELDK